MDSTSYYEAYVLIINRVFYLKKFQLGAFYSPFLPLLYILGSVLSRFSVCFFMNYPCSEHKLADSGKPGGNK